jgi:hypothetical protein
MLIKDGRIVSLKDIDQKSAILSLARTSTDSHHRSRELILPGLSGGLVVFDDRPLFWVRSVPHGSFCRLLTRCPQDAWGMYIRFERQSH